MKYLLRLHLVVLVINTILFLSCNNKSDVPPPEYDPNLCTDYSCPLHKDKMSVSLDVCPECGIQMVNANLMESLLARTAQSIQDSINVYHNRILKDSYIIMNADSISNNEIKSNALNITKNLEKAKLAHQNLDKLVFGKHRVVLKPSNVKIEKLYTVATYRVTIIVNELDKPEFEKSKIKLYTQNLFETVQQLDKEQQNVKFKSKSNFK